MGSSDTRSGGAGQTVTMSSVLAAARKLTDRNPSDAQKRTGNYRKGQLTLHGLRISIENPRHSVRRGTDNNGNAWECRLAHDYGYIRGTVGRDKDHVDVFIGPHPDSELAFVVNQVHPSSGRFDEHKVMLGFHTERDAREGYAANYNDGWSGLGDIIPLTVPQLRDWLFHGDTMHRLPVITAQRNDKSACEPLSGVSDDRAVLQWSDVPRAAVALYGCVKQSNVLDMVHERVYQSPVPSNVCGVWCEPLSHTLHVAVSGAMDKAAELFAQRFDGLDGYSINVNGDTVPGSAVRIWRPPTAAVLSQLHKSATEYTPVTMAAMIASGMLASERPQLYNVGSGVKSAGLFELTPYGSAHTPIAVDQALYNVFTNPLLTEHMPLRDRAAAGAVVAGAARRNGGTRFITPLDMGRITAGVGSGWLSGMVVGKALGILGLASQRSQGQLKNLGSAAGAIINISPLLLP